MGIGSLRKLEVLEFLKCEETIFLPKDESHAGEEYLPTSIKAVEIFDRQCRRSDPVSWATWLSEEYSWTRRRGRLVNLENLRLHMAINKDSAAGGLLFAKDFNPFFFEPRLDVTIHECVCSDEPHDCKTDTCIGLASVNSS